MSEGVLIGEGVLLEARPAGFATRALGAIIDVVLYVTVLFLMITTMVGLEITDEDWSAAVGILLVATLFVGIPVTVETLTRGRSVGKLAMGLRVVRDDGGPVRFRHALVRALVGIFELWLTGGCVAIIASLSNDRGKRLGDIAAGTYAIRVRGARIAYAPLAMPPHLAAWAANADMLRLPDGLALSARQFLGRAAKLHPASRERLGLELAGRIERYVAPGPPPGSHPELFLLAVLTARRDRDWVTARRAQAAAAEQAQLLHRLPYSVPDPPD